MKKRILYIVCVLSILVMNILFVEYQFYMLLLLVLIVPVVSWGLFIFSVSGLKMYLNLPQSMIHLNEEAVIKVKAVNKWFVFAGKQIFTIGMHYSNTKESAQEISEITGISSDVDLVSVDFKPIHCGIVDISIQRVQLQDYIGLFTAKRAFSGNCQLVVMPELVWSSRVKPYVNRKQEYQYFGRSDDNTEVVDLREYIPGDNLNHIHWNLSLRTDKLIVRQYGEFVDVQNVIIVDLTKQEEGHFRDMLDRIYMAVYSIGNLYIENEMQTVMIVWNEERKCAEHFEFDNEEGLTEAMIQLMNIPCSSRAGERAVSQALKHQGYPKESVLFVTAADYDSGCLEVVNVAKTDLQEIINGLWKKI